MLKKEDLKYLVNAEPEFIHYLPATSKESQFINEQTIVANRLQCDRAPAQQELADWIRFSSKDAEKYRDGLTTASMEIEGFSGWVVRNAYGKDNVMKNDFRERGIDNVKMEVSVSAGWILITSKDNSVATLLETGYRRFSPLLEKCCLLLAANVSFQDAEKDILVMTGIEVGHSTYHRQVQKVDTSPPNVKQKLTVKLTVKRLL